MDKNTIEIPFLGGTLVVGYEQPTEEASGAITLYADPQGLKAMASLLLAIADIDQSKFKKGDIYDRDGFHLHLIPKEHLHSESMEIVLGRLDPIDGGTPHWIKNDLPKEAKNIRIIF